jgi:D-alanyl-D-alanine carboxypeptidase
MAFVSRLFNPAPLMRDRLDAAKAVNTFKIFMLVAVITITSMPGTATAARLASILIDANDGRVLQTEEPDTPRYPASLTKMMTLYLAFEALDEGRVTLDQPLSVSAHAAAQSPTKLGLRAGQSIELENAVLGLVTKSANDAAAVLAENLAGSEENFAVRMTGKARALGMTQTVFRNASGLPDPDQVTTARDMATLALALLHHYPHYYHYFSVKEFSYRGRSIANHNRLLGTCEGVDGIKTGYTRASGFNLVASVQRGDRRLIGVVLGAPSSAVRNAMMTDLFEQAYRGESNIQLASVGRYLDGGSAVTGANLAAAIAGTRRDVAYDPPATLTSRRATSSATKRTAAAATKVDRRETSKSVAQRSATCGSGRKAKPCPVVARATTTQPSAKKASAGKTASKQLASAKPAKTVAPAPRKSKKPAVATSKPQPVARAKTAKAAKTLPPAAVRVAHR